MKAFSSTALLSAKNFHRLSFSALAILFNLGLSHIAGAQAQGVRIGATPAASPDASAILDVVATDKGMLIPRLDSAQRVQISSPAQGLMVYQKDGRQGFWYYNQPAGWTYLKPSSADNLGNHTATTTLNLQGNRLTGTGSSIGGIGIGVTAAGGLNIGQHTSNNNIYIGYGTGSAITTGFRNQFIGYNSGNKTTSGGNNLFIGYESGTTNANGFLNQFIGHLSGNKNTSGFVNQFTGYYSGLNNTSGYNNQFSGYFSGYNNTTGQENHFSGNQSGANNTTGNFNWAFGYMAGPATGNLSKSGAIGYKAQVSVSDAIVIGGTGSDAVNVGIGTTAPTQKLQVAGTIHSTTGGVMFPDGTTQTTASTPDNLGNHTATSSLNLQGNALTGTGSSITGAGIGVTATGGINIGQNTTGNNVFVGYQAGNVTTGTTNQFTGYQSGLSNTTGNRGHFDGYMSGYSNTSGLYNLFTGYQSGYNNTTAHQNQFIGYNSGYSTTSGGQNQFSGFTSGYSNTSGRENLFTGMSSGYQNSTGNYNQFYGTNSGFNNTTGSNNWAFGYQAGPSAGNLEKSGAIGYNAKVSQSNSIAIGGTGTDAVNVGIGTTAPRGKFDVDGGGDMYLIDDPNNGNAQTIYLPGHLFLSPYNGGIPMAYIQARIPNPTANTHLGMTFRTTINGAIRDALILNFDGSASFYGNVTANNVTLTSDQRFKQNIRPVSGALSSVLALRGVRYTWNELGVAHGGKVGTEQVGLLAQELEKIYPELVATDKEGFKSVNYAQLTPVLLEAIKEQQQQIEALKATQRSQQVKSEQTSADLQALQEKVARLLGEVPAGNQARK